MCLNGLVANAICGIQMHVRFFRIESPPTLLIQPFFSHVPVLVKKVMAAVMIMRTSEPTWAEAQRQLSKIKPLGVGLGLNLKA